MSADMIIELKPPINIPNSPLPLPELFNNIWCKYSPSCGDKDLCSGVTWQTDLLSILFAVILEFSHHTVDMHPDSGLNVSVYPTPRRKGPSNTRTEPKCSTPVCGAFIFWSPPMSATPTTAFAPTRDQGILFFRTCSDSGAVRCGKVVSRNWSK